MQNGFIVVDRKIFCSEIATKPGDWMKLRLYFISNVQYEDYKLLKRGQGYFTYGTISRELNVSYNIIPKFVKRATDCSMLARQKTSRGVVITVLNYDEYQEQGKTEARQKQDRSKTEAILLKEQDKQTKQNKQEKEVPLKIELREYIEKRNSLGDIGKAKKGLPQVRKLTDALYKSWCTKRKQFEYKEILDATNKYVKMIKDLPKDDRGYYAHRFTMHEFISQSNGLEKSFNS